MKYLCGLLISVLVFCSCKRQHLCAVQVTPEYFQFRIVDTNGHDLLDQTNPNHIDSTQLYLPGFNFFVATTSYQLASDTFVSYSEHMEYYGSIVPYNYYFFYIKYSNSLKMDTVSFDVLDFNDGCSTRQMQDVKLNGKTISLENKNGIRYFTITKK